MMVTFLQWADNHWVHGWRHAIRWFSVQAFLVAIGLEVIRIVWGDTFLPAWVSPSLMLVFLVFGLIGRLWEQDDAP